MVKIEDIQNHNILIKKYNLFSIDNISKIKNIDRVNLSRYNNVNSPILYVGSSTTSFITRLKNHFGVMGNRVYSLHLCKWDEGIDYNIIFYTYEVISKFEKVSKRILTEVIEQQIWDEFKPVFGKKSGL